MDNPETIGQLIHQICRTREELADDLGVSAATVYSWSVGRRTPRAENRDELARLARSQALCLNALADDLDADPGLPGGSRADLPGLRRLHRDRRQQLREMRARAVDQRDHARRMSTELRREGAVR